MQVGHELPHLVKLLDDEDPEVRRGLAKRFSQFDGDLSGELSNLGITLDPIARRNLAGWLAPGRRRQIRNDWVVPAQGFDEDGGDWESFELLLRLLSELLHDGSTVRPTLPDSLDALAEEAIQHDAHLDERSLCAYLFASGRFRANKSGFYQAANADLLWMIEQRKGNPIGLTVLAMLVGRRLDLRIRGCNFPAHFLGWIGTEGAEELVDCYNRGRFLSLEELRDNSSVLTPDAQRAIQAPCTLRVILRRILGNLHQAFAQAKNREDAGLVEELIASIESLP